MESYEGGRKNSMADNLGNEAGTNSSVANNIENEGWSKSSMADSIDKGAGSKSPMADKLGIDRGCKSPMADILEIERGSKSLEKNSCTLCLSSGPEQNTPLSVYSSVCEDVGKQKQQMHTEGHQTDSLHTENQETQLLKQDTTPEQCFLGSSVCYGGPDEYYDSLNGRKEEMNKIKTEVRKLEDAANPSNREYTTRGNWWKGKAPSTTKTMKVLDQFSSTNFR